MSTGYANRLEKRTNLAADLVRQITDESTLSYDKLAKLIGVKKSDLRYFVGLSRRNKAEENSPTDIKVKKLKIIINWIENTDFESSLYTDAQQKIAKNIKDTFVRDVKSDVYDTLAGDFDLLRKDRNADLDTFVGHYLGYRKRGTSKLITTFTLKVSLTQDQRYCIWEIKFLEGENYEVERGIQIPRQFLKTRIVSGYAAMESKNLTCIGRRKNSSEMYLINLMSPVSKQAIVWGLFSSYSRKEAIARPIALQRWDQQFSHEMDDRLGDFYTTDLMEELPFDPKKIDYDLAIESNGPKWERGFAQKPCET